MLNLTEANRSELLTKSKQSVKGKERYSKRNNSKVRRSTREMNDIDMDSLFKKGILTVQVNIQGETGNYIVTVKFEGFIDEIHKILETPETPVNMRYICQALTRCFDREDTYIHCSCPDFKYRFNYWSTINDFDAGPYQHSNGKWQANPNDKLGSCCKHGLLVLSNNKWLQTAARVITNYVLYMQKHNERLYNKFIVPALYDDTFVAQVDDTDELNNNEVSLANDERRKSTQFKKKTETPVDDEQPEEEDNEQEETKELNMDSEDNM